MKVGPVAVAATASFGAGSGVCWQNKNCEPAGVIIQPSILDKLVLHNDILELSENELAEADRAIVAKRFAPVFHIQQFDESAYDAVAGKNGLTDPKRNLVCSF
jgi:hypothetical protein